MSRLRRTGRWLILIATQLILIALLLELGVRALARVTPRVGVLTYRPLLSTWLDKITTVEALLEQSSLGYAPGKEVAGFRLNSRGFRTHEYQTTRGDGLRVVAIGDSFTYGAVPYDQSWPVQLAQQIEALGTEPEVEVISLGVPAVGPEFYLRLWQLEALRLQPDLVVLGFYIGNDLIEVTENLATRDRKPGWMERSLASRALRNAVLLLRSQDRSDLARAPSPEGNLGQQTGTFAKTYDPMRPTFLEKPYLEGTWKRFLRLYDWGNQDHVLRLIDRVRPLLLTLNDEIRTSGAELVILLIPDELQVDSDLMNRLLDLNDSSRDRLRLDLPQRELHAIFEQHGIHVVDVLQEARVRQASEPLYRVRDTHWNGAGNRLAAEAVSSYLLQNGLLGTEVVSLEGSNPSP